jgi:hypothetical protein
VDSGFNIICRDGLYFMLVLKDSTTAAEMINYFSAAIHLICSFELDMLTIDDVDEIQILNKN